MIARIQVAALILAALCFTGCETGGYGTLPGGNAERRAENLARNGQHADAAAVYIGLASGQFGTEKDRLTLLAVEQYLDAGDGQRARNALRGVQEPSGGELRWLWNTDRAAMYLFLGRPDAALEILEPMSREPLTQRHRSRAEALRADAWFQKGDPGQATALYLQRENWLDHPVEIDQNRQRLWAGLQISDPGKLRAAADVAVDDEARGWLNLGALATSTGQQGIGWSNGVLRWQETYAGHPASVILDNMAPVDAAMLEYPQQIGLLLPLSGTGASAGKALQNGFFGAYFAAAGDLDDAQRIFVYDVGALGASAAYAKAVAEGAQFVVGPLLRDDVISLANEAMLPVPVLALNNLPDEVLPPPGFFQFALAPEDEAVAVAERAISDGEINAVAIYPNNDWGRRVVSRFATTFEAAGGRLLDNRSYETDAQDFSSEIENLMGLTQSVSRYNRLRANLGQPLQFDPRRRQDVDFVFLAADSKSGRLIKSQLKFHYAGDVPVYSTSIIYSMDGRSNRDLNGIMFADTPWLIAPPAWLAAYADAYDEFWPAERRMGRLHAMGFDAYQLVSRLYGGGTALELDIVGATGALFLDENGRVHRRLAWARFEGGEPVALPSARQSAAGPFDDRPPDGIEPGALPAEWQKSGQNEQ